MLPAFTDRRAGKLVSAIGNRLSVFGLVCVFPVEEGRIQREVEDTEGEEEIGNHRQ